MNDHATLCRRAPGLWLASLFAACFVLSGCAKPAPIEWKTKTVDDRYSFEMPGEPKMQTQKQDTPAGELNMQIYELLLDNGTRAFSFMTTDLPAALGEPKGQEIEQRLDGAQQGALANVKGSTLLKSEKVTIVGYPGRDVLVQIPDAGIARMRFALMRRTMLMMEVYNVNSKDAERYFDSLKLLKDSAASEPAKPQAKP